MLLDPLARFLAQVVAIVLVARLVGLAARRLGQPMVVAEITAGILLGPSVLGWVWPELSLALFPAESLELLQLVSNLGLIPFMFLVGLEFDPRISRAHRGTSLLVSQATFLVPLGLGIVLALYLAPFAGAGTSPAVFALFIGAVLATTAFPVLARILEERRLLRSRVGAVAITAAAIDDVLAWCLLAFVVGWARADGLAEAALTSVMALAYVALMFVVVRPLLQRIAGGATSGLGHDRVAALMVLLFASSWLTHAIGIHALFGAFLLGALIPRDGGFAHALAEKLGDLVVVMLLPLFFAYNGVRTEIGLLDSAAAWLQCGLIIVVACVAKFGAGTIAARFGGLGWREASAIGILMNTRGLMVLIMLNIGLDLGVIDPRMFTMFVLMALFTTFLATPILDAVHPLRHHVADLLAEHSQAASLSARIRQTNVLVCRTPDQLGLHVLARAVASPGASVIVEELVLRRAHDPEAVPNESDLPSGLRRTAFVTGDPEGDVLRYVAVRSPSVVLLARDRPDSREWFDRQALRLAELEPIEVGVLFDAGLARLERVLVLGSLAPSTRLAVVDRLRSQGVEIVERPLLGPRPVGRFDLVILNPTTESPPAMGFDFYVRGVSVLVIHTTGATD